MYEDYVSGGLLIEGEIFGNTYFRDINGTAMKLSTEKYKKDYFDEKGYELEIIILIVQKAKKKGSTFLLSNSLELEL